MKTLIPLIEFVLDKNDFKSYRKNAEKIRAYAEFLNQDLKLWMFIPCDKEGNVLEEPLKYNEWFSEYKKGFIHEYDSLVMKQYQEAKSKVLFKGFTIARINKDYVKIKHKNLSTSYSYKTNKFHLIGVLDKVSDLVNYNLTLTQTAQTQIHE